MPDECNDWNDSPEEALFDYEDNCCKQNLDVCLTNDKTGWVFPMKRDGGKTNV